MAGFFERPYHPFSDLSSLAFVHTHTHTQELSTCADILDRNMRTHRLRLRTVTVQCLLTASVNLMGVFPFTYSHNDAYS